MLGRLLSTVSLQMVLVVLSYSASADSSDDAQLNIDQLISKAKEIASYNLKDPYSAQFRSLEFHETKGRGIICGEINAKNVYGAYVGFRPFVWSPGDSKALVLDPTSNAPDNILFRALSGLCQPGR
jgi:hypothetical protein